MKITPREQKVAELVARGYSNREIAFELKLSEHTVKNYLSQIFERNKLRSRAELVLQYQKEAPPWPQTNVEPPANPNAKRLEDFLNKRHMELIGHLLSGKNNRTIGEAMGIREGTIKNYLITIFDRVGCNSRIELILRASREAHGDAAKEDFLEPLPCS